MAWIKTRSTFYVPRSMISWYQHLPLHINPVVFSIGSFAVRWYAVSYLVGFGVVYVVLLYRIKNRETENISQISNLLLDLMLVIFFSALIGGRMGYVVFYNFAFFLAHPLAVISPYIDGKLVGIYGMSYHGALLAAILSGYIFTRIKKLNFLAWADFIIVAVPAGYFFGRLGNFFNGELYGRPTSSFLGMYFLADPSVLRFPSQLFEAFMEGVFLFLILWNIRNKKFVRQLADGSMLAIYLVGYGAFRILVEQFRQPDTQLGLLLGYFTMGQLLSAVMMFIGLIALIMLNNKKKHAILTSR